MDNYRAINSKRDNLIRSSENDKIQSEIVRAKAIQEQTGCTWTEALKAAYRAEITNITGEI
jgi:hypothetical protein